MAQLKDLIVSGPSRLIGDVYADKVELNSLSVRTSNSSSATFGLGTNNDILVSNGTNVYWQHPSNIAIGKATSDGEGNVIATTYLSNITFSGSTGSKVTYTLTDGHGDTKSGDFPTAGASTAGAITTGTQTFAGTKTFSGSVTFSKTDGFTYSGIGTASDNAARPVWFAYNGVNGRPVIHASKFTYNPATETLTVAKITGLASKATADADNNVIATTYLSNIAFSGSAGSKVTYTLTNGHGDTTTGDFPSASASAAGAITTGTQTFAGAKTFSTSISTPTLTVTGTEGFNYSGIGNGTANAARVVWFADSAAPGKPVKDSNFTYNPATKTLNVEKVNGLAAKATADANGATITSTYLTDITVTGNDTKNASNATITAGSQGFITLTKGNSDTVKKALPIAGQNMAGIITSAAQSIYGEKTLEDKLTVNDDIISANGYPYIEKKTYTDIIAANNSTTNGCFYLADIRPNNFYESWSIHLLVHAYVPNHKEYDGLYDLTIYGYYALSGTTPYWAIAYSNFNSMHTSYRPIYYSDVRTLNKTGYDAGSPILWGVDLVYSNSNTNTDYKRTIDITLLDTKNCTFTFKNTPVTYANVPNASHYYTYYSMDCVSVGLRETGDSDTYDRSYATNWIRVGTSPIHRYSLLMKDSANDGYSSVTYHTKDANDNNYNVTHVGATDVHFDPSYPVLYNSGSGFSKNEGAEFNAGLYSSIPFDFRYVADCGTTLTRGAFVYFVFNKNTDGTLSIDSSIYSQALPTTADGKVYYLLGVTYNTYQIYLWHQHPMYEFVDGKIRLYQQPTAVEHGGTGKASWTKNRLIYTAETNVLSEFAAGSSGQLLKSNGANSAPSWVNQSDITAGYAIHDNVNTSKTITEVYVANLNFSSSNGNNVVVTLVNGKGDSRTGINVPNASSSAAGVITTGTQTIAGAKTFSGAATFSNTADFSKAVTVDTTGSLTVKATNGFNYSGLQASSANVDKPLWFSTDTSTNKGIPVYDGDLTYNPSSNTLKVQNIVLNGLDIADKYLVNVAFASISSGANVQYTLTYGDSDTTTGNLPIAGNDTAGIVTAGTQSIYGAKTFKTAGFTYEAIESGSSAGARPVWFSYLGVNGRPVINSNFTYNPDGNKLTVTYLEGTAHYATHDGNTSHNKIDDFYLHNITFNGSAATAGSKVTYTLTYGDSDTTSADLPVANVPTSGTAVAGIVNNAAQRWAGDKTFANAVTVSGIFNNTGITSATDNAEKYVWFSKDTTDANKGQPVYDTDFTYNPSTNILTAISKYAIYDNDSQHNKIDEHYLADVSFSGSTGSKATYTLTVGNGDSTTKDFPTASTTVAGVVTTDAQTFAGTKTFNTSIYVTKAGECGLEVDNTQATNPNKVAFIVGSSGNGGIYSRKHSKWVVYADASGNVTLNGNANTATIPLGFSSRSTDATWGNQTGTTVTCWNESSGGSIDFRANNPSSGKMSIKIDGRFYGAEGNKPAMLMTSANNYWGMGDPDGQDSVWIRTTTQGIIPYQSGGAGSGHQSLGTSEWYFSNAYIDSIHGSLYGNATALRDKTNSTATYLNYGASGVSLSSITYLAAWNGYELRAINKNELVNNLDLYDSNIMYGNTNLAASYSPIDGLLNNRLRGNRFAGFKPAGVTIEYSANGGSTWTDYGASDTTKTALFTTSTSIRMVPSGNVSNTSQLRIIMDTGAGGVYTTLKKIMIYLSTNYSNNCKVTIDAALQSDPTNYTVKICENQPVAGWSGWNVIQCNLTTYGNTPASQYGRIRFTFKHDSITSGREANGLIVQSIYGYGGVGWTTPSTLALTDHVYTFDQSFNATFPADLTATRVYNAVWNDYAEHRQTIENIEMGRVVYEVGDGSQKKTEYRLQTGCNITSDTFGTSMNETQEAQTPIAVAGRVLAFYDGNISQYHAGDAVCSGPNGTVSKMSRREIKRYPDAIIGYVSEIPTYDIWYAGSEDNPVKIQTRGRIWIKVN